MCYQTAGYSHLATTSLPDVPINTLECDLFMTSLCFYKSSRNATSLEYGICGSGSWSLTLSSRINHVFYSFSVSFGAHTLIPHSSLVCFLCPRREALSKGFQSSGIFVILAKTAEAHHLIPTMVVNNFSEFARSFSVRQCREQTASGSIQNANVGVGE